MKEMHCPGIILLSGTPGTGKTSIARILESLFNWRIFALGDFILEKRLYTSTDETNNAKIIDTEKAAIEGVKEILEINTNRVPVKEGCFEMGDTFGDDDEKPVHKVCVDDFYIGKEIYFTLSYATMLALLTSEYVERVYI